MSLFFKKLFYSAIFNSCLFAFLIIGIQNSTKKAKVDFFINETIDLPISFLVGSSFILGSTLGAIIDLKINNE